MRRVLASATALVVLLTVSCASELPRVGTLPPLPPLGPDDALLIGAGDIARCGPQLAFARATASLVKQFPDATVFTAGDNAYPDGRPEDFANCYEPTWGAFKERTRPVPGNHDYRTDRGKPYFDYFGVQSYSSFELGAWHIVLLDSMADISEGSPQAKWLATDLAATRAQCIAAIWHHPRFSSGPHAVSETDPGRRTTTLWSILAEHRATLIINGHDHHYERFAKRDGIRQIIAGTGGGQLRPLRRVAAGSEARDARHYGVLLLILHPQSYEWRFIGTDGVVRDQSKVPEACSRVTGSF